MSRTVSRRGAGSDGWVDGRLSRSRRVGPGPGVHQSSSLVDAGCRRRTKGQTGGTPGTGRPPTAQFSGSASSTSSATAVGGVREGRGETKGDDMDTDLLSLARAGDEDAFGELVAPYRRELLVHCYRILGSLHDAEDVLQETLLSAWRGLDGFEGRSSVRTWLYRIATNRSLDAIRANARRDEPMTTRDQRTRAAAAHPSRRGPLAHAVPGRSPRPARPGARPGGRGGVARGHVAGVRDRAPAAPAQAASRPDPARRAGLPGRRGRRASSTRRWSR